MRRTVRGVERHSPLLGIFSCLCFAPTVSPLRALSLGLWVELARLKNLWKPDRLLNPKRQMSTLECEKSPCGRTPVLSSLSTKLLIQCLIVRFCKEKPPARWPYAGQYVEAISLIIKKWSSSVLSWKTHFKQLGLVCIFFFFLFHRKKGFPNVLEHVCNIRMSQYTISLRLPFALTNWVWKKQNESHVSFCPHFSYSYLVALVN